MSRFDKLPRIDLSSPDWEIRWPRLASLQDGTTIRASCELSPTEYHSFMEGGQCVRHGYRAPSKQRYAVWQNSKFKDVTVIILQPSEH